MILIISHFGFECVIWVLIAPVPVRCIHYVNVSVLIKFSQKTSVLNYTETKF